MIGAILRGIGLGAAAGYIFDPVMGRRRRAVIRDKGFHAIRKGEHILDMAMRDLRHRFQGAFAEALCRLRGDGSASNRVLEERVRAKLGRACSHPGAIDARVSGGKVTLSGPILAAEAGEVLRTIRGVRGIREVESRLEVHREAGGEPSLQGGRGKPEQRMEIFQENWAPGTRLVLGLAGSWLLLGRRRSGLLGQALGAAGAALLARSLANLPMSRILGLGAGRRALDIRKTIHIHAPVERVWSFWRDVENFPSFMAHVREVRNLGEGRSLWVVDGPAGIPFRFIAIRTNEAENRLLAWKTEPGSLVQHAGTIHFEGEAGGTLVDIRMCYNPPAGAIGGAIAAFLGSDPKSRLDEDLVRMKTLLETGRRSHDAARRPSETYAGRT